MADQDNCRQWLRANGYDKLAHQIDELVERWKAAGKKTRRNWWEILAGGRHGKPCTVDGIKFPILKAAQRRQNRPLTASALSNRGEKPPSPAPSETGRWPKKRHKIIESRVKGKRKIVPARSGAVGLRDVYNKSA